MRFQKHYKMFTGQISMVPLMNIVLLVVIYCILTQSMQAQNGINAIRGPAAVSGKEIFINIAAGGIIAINNTQVSQDSLVGYLQGIKIEGKTPSVIIKAAEHTPFGQIARIMKSVGECGD